MYKDNIEIILTQAESDEIKPNRVLYGYGYDAYTYTNNQSELQERFKKAGAKIAIPLSKTDYFQFIREIRTKNDMKIEYYLLFNLSSNLIV